MLKRVHLYLISQLQLVGPGTDNFNDLVWPNSTMVQYATWAKFNDVLCIELHLIPFLQCWGRSSSSICFLPVTVLSPKNLSLKVFLDFLEPSCFIMGLVFRWDRGSLFALSEMKLPLGVVAVVSEKGRDALGFRSQIVGSEFREGQPQVPVVLKVVNKAPELLFHDSIEPFHLAIGLVVVL